MLTTEHVLVVAGEPIPKGSLKCVGQRGSKRHALVEDNPRTEPWRSRVAEAARQLQERADEGEPIGVEITSTLPRPARHFTTPPRLRATAPAFPTLRRTGDVDKLARLVLDALQDAAVVLDDAQVTEVISRKGYPASHTPDALPEMGVMIRIYPLRLEWE
jgi:Holliday junction resolvase RusA-like endonuclease